MLIKLYSYNNMFLLHWPEYIPSPTSIKGMYASTLYLKSIFWQERTGEQNTVYSGKQRCTQQPQRLTYARPPESLYTKNRRQTTISLVIQVRDWRLTWSQSLTIYKYIKWEKTDAKRMTYRRQRMRSDRFAVQGLLHMFVLDVRFVTTVNHQYIWFPISFGHGPNYGKQMKDNEKLQQGRVWVYLDWSL